MSESSRNNKFLVVQAKVTLTPVIDKVITVLDECFKQANVKAIVTHGLSDQEGRLMEIRQYLSAKGLSGKYKEAMECNVDDKIDGHYSWQMAWSHLLHIGITINPPKSAFCLMSVSKNNIIVSGAAFDQTTHIAGTAFNIAGQTVDDITNIKIILTKAINDGVPGLLSFRIERENDTCHCDCL